MGGGDLNMKKSWHPQTMRNIERVWKKEENHASEQRKIEELQKELEEERAREDMLRFAEDSGAVGKKKDKLDWMYQGLGGAVNREDYLLGKPVDKAIMDVDSAKTESSAQDSASNSVGAIFDNSSVNLAVDMAAKVREDPLFAIKKREEQSRKDLVTNPVKMKQLQDMLRKNLSKKEKKKRKKEKKHKRSHRESSSDEEDDRKHRHRKRRSSSSNDEISPKKIRKPDGYGLINGKRQQSPTGTRGVNNRNRSPDERHDSMKHSTKEHRTKHTDDRHQSSDTHSDRHRDKYSSKHRQSDSKRDRYSDRSDSRHGDRSDRYGRSRSRSPVRRKDKGRSRSPVRRQRSPERRRQSPPRYRSRSRSPVRRSYERRPRSRSPQYSKPQEKKKRPDAEELERRRKEMMDNAKWRGEQRKHRVHQYKAEDDKEKEMEKKKSKDAEFLQPLKLPAALSVEQRIKSKINSIQRTNAALDKNFAKR